MNRLLLILAVVASMLAGCMPSRIGSKDNNSPALSVAQRPPTVYPDQVNDCNAHAMAEALDAEIKYDAQTGGQTTSPH